ncbi:S41 family peptidase [Picrophilus oshimae]|uniref:Tricorn protease n=1 Tax=Picrophilus torridus (strain ATCC 700027 / DSM 9790 / JCM 10055 / NBRC 100828 / KAW 2/3) TaxID=1122961 RepID=Q6L0V3_PICTO|nr:S41 family peptidase [Picrophilus oshimae]AAT43399.1 tricorn protease [Picrophilus oshimae DSM 9789]
MQRYFMYPDIRDDLLVFVNDDDLWEYNISTKEISRLTYNMGVVTMPRISPDKMGVYFRVMTGKSADSSDIYYVSLNTGEISRVTYLQGRSTSRRMYTSVAGFTRDGNPVISTDAYYPFSSPMLYELKNNNLYPMNLGPAMEIIYNGDGILIGRNTVDMPHWKHYRGGTRGKILYSDNGRDFKIIVDLDSNVNSPMIVSNRIYFISDHEGTANIYSCDLNGKNIKKETDFNEYYVRNARSDGKNIVFQMAGDLYLMGNGIKKLDINIKAPKLKSLQKSISMDDFITSYDISPDGKRFLAVSRGQVYSSGISGGPVFNIKKLKNQVSVFSKDCIVSYIYNEREGKILFHDFNGRLINEKDFNDGIIRSMVISPDGKKIAIGNNRFSLYILDDQLNLKKVDESESGAILDFSWSGDSRLLAYSYPEKKYFLSDVGSSSIRIYDTVNDSIHQVTTPGYIDFSPSFSSDNSYLFYLSKRSLDPVQDELVFDLGYQNITKPFAVPVRSGVRPPFIETLSENNPGDYDLNNLDKKSTAFPVDSRNYEALVAVDNGVLLFHFPVEGYMKYYLFSNEKRTGKISFFDLAKKKEEDYEDHVMDFSVSLNKKYLLIRKPDSYIKKNTGDKKTEEIKIKNISIMIDPVDEWRNMLYDAFKLIQENFWNPEKVEALGRKPYEKYAKLIDKIGTRFELSDLIREMQGEYETSHSYEIGGDITDVKSVPVGKLGIDYSYKNGKYIVDEIYYGDVSNENEKSPMLFTSISRGDAIIEINGVKLDEKTNIDMALLNITDPVNIVYEHEGKLCSDYVMPMRDEKYLRYRAWVERNRDYVHKKTDNRIGYIHIPDMGMNGFNEFFRLYSRESKLDGLIVDLRFNGGGFVSQLLMEKLARKRIGYDIPRRGVITPYPEDSVDGPMIAITNEYAGSDGDIGTFVFKQYKLGKVIGTRTWGGVVGINPNIRLIDGTTVTQPQFATWFKGVKYGIENYGVDPDIYIENMPQDFLNSNDKQLDEAIKIIMDDLKNYKKLNID